MFIYNKMVKVTIKDTNDNIYRAFEISPEIDLMQYISSLFPQYMTIKTDQVNSSIQVADCNCNVIYTVTHQLD